VPPLYSLKCAKCGSLSSRQLSVDDRTCQQCAVRKKRRVCGGSLKVQVAPSSFTLKGSGWSKDGYQ
jgi:predicted nucleic acid-binding Zn ribbon protein